MTFLDMQLELELEFQTLVDKHLDMRSVSMEHYLNDGYKAFIEEWYEKFEFNEGARKRLNPLIGPVSISPSGPGSHKNSFLFPLAGNFKYTLQEEAEIRYKDCNDEVVVEVVPVVPIKLDYYNKHVKNPFKKPYKKFVWRLDIGDKTKQHELIHGDDTLDIISYNAIRLMNPAKITLLSGTPMTSTIEIPVEFHSEVIDKARESALGMYQTASNFKSKQ